MKDFKEFITKLSCTVLAALIITLCALTIMWSGSEFMTTNKSVNNMLWRQATEKQLQDQSDRYKDELYDRYSKINKNLNEYQYITGKRIESLENRVKILEENSKGSSFINIQSNAIQSQ